MKDRGASWRHSADTATIERRSKVIDRPIRDTRRAEKWRMIRTRNKDVAALVRPLRESAARSLLCRNFIRPRAHGIGDNEAFATVLPASELEQSAFVAFSSKNGLHRPARRPVGKPDARAGRRAVQ